MKASRFYARLAAVLLGASLLLTLALTFALHWMLGVLHLTVLCYLGAQAARAEAGRAARSETEAES